MCRLGVIAVEQSALNQWSGTYIRKPQNATGLGGQVIGVSPCRVGHFLSQQGHAKDDFVTGLFSLIPLDTHGAGGVFLCASTIPR
jgi:hypothetical protein